MRKIIVLEFLSRAAAHFRSGEPGHDPVEDHQARRILALQYVPGLQAVLSDDDFVSPLPEGSVQQMPGNDAVVGNQNAHVFNEPGR